MPGLAMTLPYAGALRPRTLTPRPAPRLRPRAPYVAITPPEADGFLVEPPSAPDGTATEWFIETEFHDISATCWRPRSQPALPSSSGSGRDGINTGCVHRPRYSIGDRRPASVCGVEGRGAVGSR